MYRDPAAIGLAETVDDLRRLLPRLEAVTGRGRIFPFGLESLDRHLPHGGLAAGVLHEIVPKTEEDLPVAFGFVAALLAGMVRDESALLVSSPRGFADFGEPHGHGLNSLGLDPARVVFVTARDESQALWAIEQGLHSAAPSAVAGVIASGVDLKTSQRLNLAAGKSGLPLILLRPGERMDSSVAATRWRVGATRGIRDRFGLLARWRWHVRLERCRNGRPGEWLVEWDHAAYRFSLAAPMADPAFFQRADEEFPAIEGIRS